MELGETYIKVLDLSKKKIYIDPDPDIEKIVQKINLIYF